MKIEEGARVRVTYEGTAEEPTISGMFILRHDNGRPFYIRHSEADVEVLAPPKPQYRVGQMYRMRENHLNYLRVDGGFILLTSDGRTWPVDPYPGCTFDLLVPETS